MEKRAVIQRKPSKSMMGAITAAAVYLIINGLYWYASSDRLISLLFSFGSAGLLLVVYFLYRRLPHFDEEKLFLAVLCSTGLFYMVVFTPFTVPDELYHFWASYSLSNTLMGNRESEDPLDMREEDAEMVSNLTVRLQLSEYDQIREGFSDLSSSAQTTSVKTGGGFGYDSNPPQLKIASALGITLARLLNAGPYFLLYLGRLFNFLFYAVLVWFAFRITPIGKGAFATVSLLPMSLHLAASYSYDAGIIGLSLLLIALCLRAFFRDEMFGWKEGIEIVVVAALLAPCKVVYVLLAILALFIPSSRFSSKRQELFIKIGCALLVAIILLITKLPSIISNTGASNSSAELWYRGDESGYSYTLSDMLNNPLKTIIIYVRTLATKGSFYLSSMLGSNLGWFQVEIAAPSIVTVELVLILTFATLRSADDEKILPTHLRIVCVIIFLTGMLVIMASMLFGWTFNTEPAIEGVQGRYFLPYLPVLLLGLRPSSLRIEAPSAALAMGMLAVVNAAYLSGVFATALTLV